MKEDLAAYLHSLWAKWMREFLNRCVPHSPTAFGDMSLMVPDDLRRRMIVQMGIEYQHLSDKEKRELFSDVEDIVELVGTNKTVISSYDRGDNTLVSTTNPMVVWRSMKPKPMSKYRNSIKSTEDLAQWMSKDEMDNFAKALERLDKESGPIVQIRSIETRTIPGRGKVKVVRCNKELAKRARGLSNTSVIIDGVNWFVVNVECFMPVREGDNLGLVVRRPVGDERLVKCGEHGWAYAVRNDDSPVLVCSECYSADEPPFQYLEIVEEEK